MCEKKRTGQDRTGQEKKSQKGYISPICGEAPTEAMYMKICAVGDVLDVITCAKFQKFFKFLGVTILHGVEFSIFLIDFKWALQQCSATALPVIGLFLKENCNQAFYKLFPRNRKK